MPGAESGVPQFTELPTVLPAELRADCSRCAALCCVAPSFDAVQGFGFDKPAHSACPHLQADHRCGIHAELRPRGFPGCAVYDCHGAGQWVTQQLFAGRPWPLQPDGGRQQFEQFMRVRPLFELLMLLTLALQRPGHDAALDEALRALREELQGVREEELNGRPLFNAMPWRERVFALLRRLA